MYKICGTVEVVNSLCLDDLCLQKVQILLEWCFLDGSVVAISPSDMKQCFVLFSSRQHMAPRDR